MASLDLGFNVLAMKRDGRYLYRPHKTVQIMSGDELLAYGSEEGRAALAESLGWRLVAGADEHEQELELEPLFR